MYDTESMLDQLKKEIDDETVFSYDQIIALQDFAGDLDRYIEAKICNFASRNL